MRPLLAACGFLTSLPVPTDGLDERDVGRAAAWFPVIGLALGAVLAVAADIFDGMLPATLVAIGLTALLAGMTGGLHLDGLADLFDGRGGWRGDRDRMLAIMRDSRLGAHGAVALVLALVAKIAALAAIVDADVSGALIAFPAVARWCAVPLIVAFPYARGEGLGVAFKRHASGTEVAIASAVILVVVLVLGGSYAVAALAALATALALALWTQAAVGGLTGDVYGAAIELAEVVFLVTLIAVGMR